MLKSLTCRSVVDVARLKLGKANYYSTVPKAFVRPSTIPVPTVWYKFKGRTALADGKVPNLKVQDITDDIVPDILKLMSINFVNEEPLCNFINMKECDKSMNDSQKYWAALLTDKVGVVCVVDEELAPGQKPRIAGFNVTFLSSLDTKPHQKLQFEGEKWNTIMNTMRIIAATCNVYEKYGVENYLNGTGLVVDHGFRGQNIGVELLRTRRLIGQAMGLKATVAIFNSKVSQVVAKGWFQTLGELKYKDIARKHGIVYPGIDTDTALFMGMRLD